MFGIAALRYALGRRAVVLVLDVAEDHARVTEETWPDAGAKRLMVRGRFDHLIVAAVPLSRLLLAAPSATPRSHRASCKLSTASLGGSWST
jgi:hypothetical protein